MAQIPTLPPARIPPPRTIMPPPSPIPSASPIPPASPHPCGVDDPTRIASGNEAMIAPPGDGARLPFAGYDRLDTRQLVVGLSGHTQLELEAVESYERSHKARKPVLDKMRYLRGREPLPGYDALDAREILAAVGKADVATIKRVRAYERKFRGRPKVLHEVARVQRAHREQGGGR